MYPMPSSTSTPSRATAASLVATAMHMRRAQRLGVDAKSLAVVDEQERCRYPSKFCGNKRAVKSTGRLHRFCEHHRRRANQNQKRWSQMRRAAPQPSTPLVSAPRSLLSPTSSCMSSPRSSPSVHATPVGSPIPTDWITQHACSSEWSSIHVSMSGVSAACHHDAWCVSPSCPSSPSHPADVVDWSFMDATSSESETERSSSSSDCDSVLSSDEITTLLALLDDDEEQQQCGGLVSSGVNAGEMLFASHLSIASPETCWPRLDGFSLLH